jgi:hypothetical protein
MRTRLKPSPLRSCGGRSVSPSSAALVSQILTLYTTPVIYRLIDRLQQRSAPGAIAAPAE